MKGSSIEIRSRLVSVLDVCANEAAALAALEESLLDEVLGAMSRLRATIIMTLTALPDPHETNGGS
jgi:hypothetical protein